MIDSIKLTNPTTGTILEVSEDHPTFILETCGLGELDAVFETQSVIGADGANISDVRYGTRNITIVGWVIGANDSILTKYRRTLNTMIDPKQTLILSFKEFSITGIPTHTVKYGTSVEVCNDKMCMFMIDLFCKDGLFTLSERSKASAEQKEKKLVFPMDFTIDDPASARNQLIRGLISASTIITLENMGDVEVPFAATFTAKGHVVNPQLINIATEEYITVQATLEDGDKLVISSEGLISKATKISGGAQTNMLNYITEGSTWFKLPVGLCSLGYTAAVGSSLLTVQVEYNTRFLEVL